MAPEPVHEAKGTSSRPGHRIEPPRHQTLGAFGQVESTVTLGRLAPGVGQGGSGQNRHGHCQVDPPRTP